MERRRDIKAPLLLIMSPTRLSAIYKEIVFEFNLARERYHEFAPGPADAAEQKTA